MNLLKRKIKTTLLTAALAASMLLGTIERSKATFYENFGDIANTYYYYYTLGYGARYLYAYYAYYYYYQGGYSADYGGYYLDPYGYKSYYTIGRAPNWDYYWDYYCYYGDYYARL
jgi:hypothetical protein